MLEVLGGEVVVLGQEEQRYGEWDSCTVDFGLGQALGSARVLVTTTICTPHAMHTGLQAIRHAKAS